MNSMNFTLVNSQNEREVEMMFGKALCAYANWKSLDRYKDLDRDCYVEYVARRNEYEATVRCISMFVRESLPLVCHAVVEEANKQLEV